MKDIFSLIQLVKINWFSSEKYFFDDESVKRHITDSISENLTDSDFHAWTMIVFERRYSKQFIFHPVIIRFKKRSNLLRLRCKLQALMSFDK